jgi:hypothetical protein
MNIWLHKQLMVKLAENGKVPSELKTRSRPPAAHALGGTADAGTSFFRRGTRMRVFRSETDRLGATPLCGRRRAPLNQGRCRLGHAR